MASTSSSRNPPSSPEDRTNFETPEGRYNLEWETQATGIVRDSDHARWVSQLTIAHLKENPAPQAPPSASSSSKTTPGSSVGMKAAAAKIFVKIKSLSLSSCKTAGGSASAANYDGSGTYIIFNVSDWLVISDIDFQQQMKYISFDSWKPLSHAFDKPLCHAFDPEAKDGHDLLVGLLSGEIYTMSLRRQLESSGMMLVGAQHYNRNGKITKSHCTSVAWVPDGGGSFVSAHADGCMYVYQKNKDWATNPSFPAINDPIAIINARSSKCNPTTRWHILQGTISNISFSMYGSYLAIVSSDGYLRVFDYDKKELLFAAKSTCDAFLCCAWSLDGQYIVTGGDDGLVHIWNTQSMQVVAYGEGHHSWVSRISFDSYWSAPNSDVRNSDITRTKVAYRFGSVGQDGRLLIWNLESDKIFIPEPPSLTTLQPSLSIEDIPKLSPVGGNSGHVDPLSDLIFAENSLVAISSEGNMKYWARPGRPETSHAN